MGGMDDAEKRQLEEFWQLLKQGISGKMALLPTYAMLAAALIVVATFGPSSGIPIVWKIPITLLLLVISVSLRVYYSDLVSTVDKAKAGIEKIIKKEFPNPAENPVMSKLTLIKRLWPLIARWIIEFVVAYIVVVLWANEIAMLLSLGASLLRSVAGSL